MFQDLSLKEFVETTASNAPTPGGGSIAAENGAIAYALAEMVARLSLDRKECQEHRAEFEEIIQTTSHLRNELLEDIDNDANSFNEVMTAFKLPKTTPEEKAFRTEKIQEGYKYAASVPLNIAEKMLEHMHVFDFVITHGNQNALTDGLVGLMTARAAVLASLLNTKINLSSIKDEQFVKELTEQVERIAEQVKTFETKILHTHI